MKKPRTKCGTVTKAKFARHVEGELPKRIGWWHDSRFKLPGMSITATRDAMQAIFTFADAFVPIDFYRTRKAKQALIVMMMGPEDEFDSNTLAMADMRNLRDPEQREVWWSPLFRWTTGVTTDDAINPLGTGAHEVGHTLGFGHGETGLMAPAMDALVMVPTHEEMKRFFQEYPELASKQ